MQKQPKTFSRESALGTPDLDLQGCSNQAPMMYLLPGMKEMSLQAA